MADQAEAALLERHSHDESCHGASAPISIDDALELAGGWSTFQWRLLCCLGMRSSSPRVASSLPIRELAGSLARVLLLLITLCGVSLAACSAAQDNPQGLAGAPASAPHALP